MINIDTEKMKEYGNDIIGLSQSFNDVVQDLYARLINITAVTQEWQGVSAIAFVEKAKKDKINVLKLKQKIYKCGEALVKNAQNYEDDVRKLVNR